MKPPTIQHPDGAPPTATAARAKASPSGERITPGERTRRDILAIAVNVASVDGLEGLTIGRLATELGMSKAGLFAHFGSKEALQLATVDAAQRIVFETVVNPVMSTPRGLARLRGFLENYESYARSKVLAGGCFFSAASAEFDDRPGRVRDRIVAIMREWLELIETLVREAQDEGELDASVPPDQLAFELHALSQGATRAFQLHQDPLAFERGRRAIDHRLRGVARGAQDVPPPRGARRTS